MSNSRNITFDLQQCAEMFKALSNPNRLRIFQRLASCCEPGTICNPDSEACVGELGEDLEISSSTLSHHMKELHRAGLIQMERRGQRIGCWVDPNILQYLSDFFKL